MPVDRMVPFVAMAQATQRSLVKDAPAAAPADPRATLSDYIRTRKLEPGVVPALAAVVGGIGDQIRQHGSFARVPTEAVSNVRNDMYVASETIRFLEKNSAVVLGDESRSNLKAFKKQMDDATKFIPLPDYRHTSAARSRRPDCGFVTAAARNRRGKMAARLKRRLNRYWTSAR